MAFKRSPVRSRLAPPHSFYSLRSNESQQPLAMRSMQAAFFIFFSKVLTGPYFGSVTPMSTPLDSHHSEHNTQPAFFVCAAYAPTSGGNNGLSWRYRNGRSSP